MKLYDNYRPIKSLVQISVALIIVLNNHGGSIDANYNPIWKSTNVGLLYLCGLMPDLKSGYSKWSSTLDELVYVWIMQENS